MEHCNSAPLTPILSTCQCCTLPAVRHVASVPPSPFPVPFLRQGRVPGELMEVFAEKMLVACQALLGVVAELKRNAVLNDVPRRNAEVRPGNLSGLLV